MAKDKNYDAIYSQTHHLRSRLISLTTWGRGLFYSHFIHHLSSRLIPLTTWGQASYHSPLGIEIQVTHHTRSSLVPLTTSGRGSLTQFED